MSPSNRADRRVQRVFATLLLVAGILVPITTSATPASASVPPVAVPGGPYAGAEGAPIAIDGSGSTDSDGTIVTYAWTSVPAGTFGNDADAVTTFTAPDDGTYTLTLTVIDDADDSHFDTTTVTASNADPVVDAGPDDTAFTGVPFALNATFTDAGVDDTHGAVIQWGDGTPDDVVAVGSASSPLTNEHTYAAPGPYVITVTVTDDDGGSHSGTLNLNVNDNVTPTADQGTLTYGPVAEGAAVAVDGTASSDSDGSIDTYAWSAVPAVAFADAAASITTFTAPDDGSYTITLTVTDDAGGTDFVDATATITNAAPVVDAGPDDTAITGVPFALNATFTDPGTDDTHSASIQWGDGSPDDVVALGSATSPLTNEHTYAVAGPYAITVTVTDDDGGSHADVVNVTVDDPPNQDPVPDPGGPYVGDEGDPITVDGTASYDPDGPISSWHWSRVSPPGPDDVLFGNPWVPVTTFTAPDNGVYDITLLAGDDGGVGPWIESAPTTVTVANVTPSIDAGVDVTLTAGDTYTSYAAFTDPGADDTHIATIDWGDGSLVETIDPAVSPIAVSHTYLTSGTYTLTVGVADDDEPTVVVADSLQVVVDPVNTAPSAGSDTFSVRADTFDNRLDVLADDTDSNGDSLDVWAWTTPTQPGAVVDCHDGDACLYTPPPGFTGTDTFTYTVSDGKSGTDTATVTVNVLGACQLVSATIGNGIPESEDGSFSVTVDALGAFGTVSRTGDALYNPPGSLTSYNTAFTSNVYLSSLGFLDGCPGDAATATIVEQDSDTFRTTTTVGDLTIEVDQEVVSGVGGSASLSQTYRITNNGSGPLPISILRFLDGDLQVSPIGDTPTPATDTAVAAPDGSELFIFDSAANVTTPAPYVAISGSLGSNTVPDRWAAKDFDETMASIIANDGIASGDNAVVDNDTNGDGISDTPFDVTASQQWDDSIAPAATAVFTTTSTFGFRAPKTAQQRSFQNGVSGYSGTLDTYLNEGAPTADNSTNTTLVVDLLDGTTPEAKHVLLRFADIFGGGAHQIPSGSTIVSATLGINVSNASVVGADLYRMVAPWNDTDSWSTWGSGISTDDLEAASVSESGSPGSGTGSATIDVTADLQAWSDGAANHGWAWLQDPDDSWQFNSSEVATVANRPALTVQFTSPGVDAAQVRVSQSSDDAEESVSAGTVSLTSTDLELVEDGTTTQLVGIRFPGLSVPRGALITSAYIDFTVDETSTAAASLGISGEATDDAATFTTASGDISGRSTTTARVDWSPDAWSTVGTVRATSDIAAVVQEIINRSGWASGNAMAFIFDGTGTRVAEAFDGVSGAAPLLVVEYTTDPTISVSGTPLSGFTGEPGIPSTVQSYSVSGNNLTADIVVTAPTDFEVSTLAGGPFAPSVSLAPSDGVVAATDVFVRMNRATEGATSGDIVHTSTGAATVNVPVSGTAVTIPDEWIAYNDMNTSAGAANPANVTSYEYDMAGALKDYATGVVLPVTVTGSTTTPGGPDQYTDGGPVTNAASDAYAAFDGIVDLTGTDQLILGESSTLTFDNLDPTKRYTVTLSANRNDPGYADNRFAEVTINGVDAATAESSVGVVKNPAGSVSFSIGDNSANGYVAKWVNVNPGADGSFTITSEWDDSLGTVPAGTDPNTKGYAMAAFKLETYTPPPPPADWVAYNDMNTSAGAANPDNVTSYRYDMAGSLRDYDTGVVLPVTVTGSTLGGYDPHTSGGPVTNTSSDAHLAFGGIVDLSGSDELDSTDWDSVLTFDNLDPSKTYTITLSANRDNPGVYTGQRFARVTIGGVVAATAASSTGVVTNLDGSVSFSVGDNSTNGYVARWTDIAPGPDGSFSVKSEWDDSHPGTKGYAMAAFKLEATTLVAPAVPLGLSVTPVSVSELLVSWDDVEFEDAYEVEVGPSGGAYVPVVGSPFAADSTSFSATGLTEGVEYCYIVQATNAAGASGFSAEVCGIPAVQPNWSAFIDLRSSVGDVNAPNVLEIPEGPVGSPIDSLTAFDLIDIGSGALVGATLQIDNSGIDVSSDDGGPFTGGPAFDVFDGIVDPAGVYAFADAGDVWQLNFAGLDPSMRYEIVLSTNAAEAASPEAWTDVSIEGVRYSGHAEEASGGTTTVVSQSQVRFESQDNTARGDLARWQMINPGPDGTFAISSDLFTVPGSTVSYAPVVVMVREFAPDEVTAPEQTITAPGNWDSVLAPVTLAGTATDNAAVESVEIEIYDRETLSWWNGSDWQTDRLFVPASVVGQGTPSATWSYVFDPGVPSPQPYWWTLKTTDTSGNVVNSVSNFVVLPSDETAPGVSVSAPVNWSAVPAPVSVVGSASDDVGVVSVMVEVYDRDTLTWWNGTDFQAGRVSVPALLADPGALVTDWSLGFDPPDPALQPYWVNVRSFDAAGNASGFANTNFTIGDGTPPGVSVLAPVNWSAVPAPVSVVGSASDDVGVVSVMVEVYDRDTLTWWNGTDFQAARVSVPALLADPGALVTDWSLGFDPPDPASQPYWVNVRSFDAAGNASGFANTNFTILEPG